MTLMKYFTIFQNESIKFSITKLISVLIYFVITKWKGTVNKIVRNEYNRPPPAHDSPQNIINILNDDCIQAILLKLEFDQDFFNAAEVCIRFQENVKFCLPFRRITFGDDQLRSTIPFELTERFLKIFATNIKCINLNYNETSVYQHHLDLISHYCGNTLRELSIRSRTNHSILTFHLPFAALNKLLLRNVYLHNFNPTYICPELKNLQLFFCYDTEYLKWLENEFSNLTYVEFNFSHLTIEILNEFKQRNSQLMVVEERIINNKPYSVILKK